MWPWWIDIAASTVGFVVVGLATLRLIVGHTRAKSVATEFWGQPLSYHRLNIKKRCAPA